MYKSRIVNRLSNGLKNLSSSPGLTCLITDFNLNLTKTSIQVQRFCRASESILMKNKSKAASTIAKEYRKYKTRQYNKKIELNEQLSLKISKAVKIQKYFRQYKQRRLEEMTRISDKISEIRDKAASFIQTEFKLFKLRKKRKILRISEKIKYIRHNSAKCIQSTFKGYLVRKDLFFIRDRFNYLVTWKGTAEDASMVGNFTYPPWKVEIPLVYSKYLNLHYSLFFDENKLPSGKYFLKFKINETFHLSYDLPSTSLKSGESVNIMKLHYQTPSTSSTSSASNTLESPKSSSSLISATFPDNSDDQTLNYSPTSPTSSDSPSSSNSSNSGNSCLHAELPLTSPPCQQNQFSFREPSQAVLSKPRSLSTNSSTELKLFLSSSVKAKPYNRMTFKAALPCFSRAFTLDSFKCFGVACGVEDWETQGIDPGSFPEELLASFQEELLRQNRESFNHSHLNTLLEATLTSAYNRVKSTGNASVFIGILIKSTLCTLSIGNMQMILMRKLQDGRGKVLIRTRKTDIGFGVYELLGKVQDFDRKKVVVKDGERFKWIEPEFNSAPLRCRAERMHLEAGDLVFAGNDGVFDNLDDRDFEELVEKWHEGLGLEQLASQVLRNAEKRAWDGGAKCPFYYYAKGYGKKVLGGRLSDFAVVVGRVEGS